MRIVLKGATSQIEMVEVLDSTSTTGGRKTGLAFNTSSLTAYYTRAGAAAVSISLVTQTVTGAWTTGGFVEVSSANAPGLYRVDVPDAAYVTGADSVVITLKGATGMVQVSKEIMLVAFNPQDAVRLGLTALPNAAANAAGGLPVSTAGSLDLDEMNVDIEAIQTSTAGLTYTVANQVDTNVVDWKGATAPAMTGDAFARLGAPAGASISADIAEIEVETDLIVASTSGLTFTVANQVDANVLDWKSATAPAMTGDAFARLGAPAGASIAADIAEVEGETDTLIAGVTVTTNSDKTGYALTAGEHTTINTDTKTQVVAALNTDTYAESAAVPAATATLAAKIGWLATLARNKITQTATTQTLRNSTDAGTVATSTVSDDATTFTRGTWT